MKPLIELIKGDIFDLDVDAIVNPAHETLRAGGGLSGAIHSKAGIELEKECLKFGGLEAGGAVITAGYNLKSKYVIHTVTPRYYLNEEDREEKFAKAYKSVIELADEKNLKSIAFPSIGTGINGWPLKLATKIAIKSILNNINHCKSLEKIYIVCYNNEQFEMYSNLI